MVRLLIISRREVSNPQNHLFISPRHKPLALDLKKFVGISADVKITLLLRSTLYFYDVERQDIRTLENEIDFSHQGIFLPKLAT